MSDRLMCIGQSGDGRPGFGCRGLSSTRAVTTCEYMGSAGWPWFACEPRPRTTSIHLDYQWFASEPQPPRRQEAWAFGLLDRLREKRPLRFTPSGGDEDRGLGIQARRLVGATICRSAPKGPGPLARSVRARLRRGRRLGSRRRSR